MALTRKMLKAMGIEDEKIEQIIDAHTETVDALKDEVENGKKAVENFKNIQKELDELKNGDYKAKFEKEHKDFEDFKAGIATEKNKAAKEKAVKDFFESKNITGRNLEIAMRGCGNEIAALEMEDGKLKDTKALDDLVAGTYAGLVQTTHTQGAATPNPPANGANSATPRTRGEIMAIKDTAERQKAIAENPTLFGID